jgi:hypothetical protein
MEHDCFRWNCNFHHRGEGVENTELGIKVWGAGFGILI